MTDPAGEAASLSLLKTLHPPSTGSSRAWQSLAHPDPSTPLLATASADKSVNIYSLRDFTLVSTISGGHKRSVRTVSWKDFGGTKRATKGQRKDPVVLGTGSFDANVGIWVWNDRQQSRLASDEQDGAVHAPNHADAEDVEAIETDMNAEEEGNGDDEEWHFSTLLTGPDSEIKSIDFSPPYYPANLLATSSRDKSVWIWEEVEPEEWETIAVLSEHTGDVKCVGWCTGAERRRKGSKRRKLAAADGDVDMGGGGPSLGEAVNGLSSTTTAQSQQRDEDGGEEDEDVIIGARPVLASGSYDDTIRLWRDVEEEGDWICIAVIASHAGTVWDVKWEGHVNYNVLDLSSSPAQHGTEDAAISEFEADWQPRILSCSDDLSVRVWRRELSASEKEQRRQQQHKPGSLGGSTVGAPMGFASSRIPNVIRPMSAMENWVEDATLPQVHVRSVYAVDWSKKTGMVVSCGGDGTVAVYMEVATPTPSQTEGQQGNVTMNGTSSNPPANEEAGGSEQDLPEPYRLHATEWRVVAQMEAAHDEYEINHVCWAQRRDSAKRFDGEEMIVSTGDEGDVRVWILPEELVRQFQER